MTVTYKGPWGRKATNSKGVRTYTRGFKLESDDKNDDEYTVGSHASLPLIGSTHPSDPLAWCTTLDVDNAWPWKGWLVTATYSSEYEMSDNPLNEPVRISYDGEKYQEVADADKDDKAIINAAGDYFTDPPVMRDRTNRIIRLQKNLFAVPSWFLSLDDAVNSSAVTIGGVSLTARQGKIDRVAVSELQSRNGISFYTVSVDVHCRQQTWDAQPLQAGYTYLKDGHRVKALNEGDHTSVVQPVLLTSSGERIEDPTPADAAYGQFRIYQEVDFATYLPLT